MPSNRQFNCYNKRSCSGASLAKLMNLNMNKAKEAIIIDELADADCCSDDFFSHGACITSPTLYIVTDISELLSCNSE